MNNKIYQAYSDESGINYRDRYTSVCVISGEEIILNCLRDELAKEIGDNEINEVKFVKITRYKSPIAQTARSIIKIAINDFAVSRKIRIDTMTMDNQFLLSESPNYNKEQRLEHMYYCLLSHIVRRWNNTHWNFYPDINSKINWDGIISYLNMTKIHKNKNPLLIELLSLENPRFKFDEVKQLSSIQEPLIQIADLFAGLARFSHEKGADCVNWVIGQKNRQQQEMELYQDNKVNNANRTSECRFKLIGELYSLCHQNRLGVSIKTKKHLNTWRPKNPINFWDYQKSITKSLGV